MQTSNTNQIEPALRGTRYGQALENAARAIQTRRIREAEDQAAWEAAHPECRINRLTNIAAQAPSMPSSNEDFDSAQAHRWAAALTLLADGGWHPIPGNTRTVRIKLVDMFWADARGHTFSRAFQITDLGRSWLHDYRAHHAGRKHV
jgi:hypothetical protein